MKLDDSLGFLLNKSASEMKYALETALRPYDLTPAQWSVLARLFQEDGQAISDLGKSLHFDRPTMSGIIRRLLNKNLLVKQKDDQDQRISRIFLTDSGKQIFSELPPLAKGVNDKALRTFEPDEIKAFKEYLRRVLNNMA